MKVQLEILNSKAKVKRVSLTQDTTIGRSADCQLRVASGEVSRQHCTIKLTENGISLIDHGSSNGAYVDGSQIPANEHIDIAAGTAVKVGPLCFVPRFTPASIESDTKVAGAVESETVAENTPSVDGELVGPFDSIDDGWGDDEETTLIPDLLEIAAGVESDVWSAELGAEEKPVAAAQEPAAAETTSSEPQQDEIEELEADDNSDSVFDEDPPNFENAADTMVELPAYQSAGETMLELPSFDEGEPVPQALEAIPAIEGAPVADVVPTAEPRIEVPSADVAGEEVEQLAIPELEPFDPVAPVIDGAATLTEMPVLPAIPVDDEVEDVADLAAFAPQPDAENSSETIDELPTQDTQQLTATAIAAEPVDEDMAFDLIEGNDGAADDGSTFRFETDDESDTPVASEDEGLGNFLNQFE